MPSKKYFSDQANLSRRLSRTTTDEILADRLRQIADEYDAEALSADDACMADRPPMGGQSSGDEGHR